MGLETEKADVQLFMDDDSYSHHSGLEYADPEKFADSGQDRDPHRLNSHLKDFNAFCKDLPNGSAFSADNMEECDRCFHCSIVYKRRTKLLFCQPATEPGLNTWTPGLEIRIL
ncbi:caveolin-2 isoform X2 [Rhinopithecus roxellana]|uniref:Caveolin 2 n=2 Tax=Rhinopithecus TaxID=542827 RepID=A0A2K6LSX1_RHIBE|nr:caveolin-2 isoform X1 [Papio anubis]XP_010387652.1 caveolin-2 isoform X2 [Rhinopithecus roxellana]XP_017726156.1 PREDICTED: caveolin-2 isoform X3 [Rhinopithecus bieti]XP_025236077.1 caveolin-2 isoform X3 [Theropithecus gelada]